MAYNAIGGFPTQQLSFSKKTRKWRMRCVDFGDDFSLLHYHLTRKSVREMKINYDLLNGKIHMEDLKAFINPYNIDASFIPDNIQHYSVVNSKLNVLRGEETDRLFDFRAVVTNATAISEIEKSKNDELNQRVEKLIANQSQSDDQFKQKLSEMNDYFDFEWQDKREQRANMLLNHYTKELCLEQLFNKGFVDAYTVGEELYQIDIVGGEPVVYKLDPTKVRIIRSGYSDKVEDADMIIIEDYWSPGKVIDTYWDQLQPKDIKAIENMPNDTNDNPYVDSMSNLDERYGFVPSTSLDVTTGDQMLDVNTVFGSPNDTSLLPYDRNGNVRVLKVFWKSRRKIKKVKSYNPETGEEEFNFRPENFVTDPDTGEEEESFWINEAWEGVKIAKDIYVGMGPRPVQYNRLSNPSVCHFGIIGSLYNINGNTPFSLIDMVKPYCYAYDMYHDKLNKLISRSIGKAVRLDFAKVPDGWSTDKWLYYLKTAGIAVENSYNEGKYGAATGKLAGGLNNASSGVIDASLGSDISEMINILTWIDSQIGQILGISKQREGQIANRETVGGVERATLQSSHITKYLFFIHDDVKRRVMECLLETAKIALRGRKKKFSYILPSGAEQIMEIDGDEFAECDYGIVVENDNNIQILSQRMDMLAQAALQNQLIDFSTMMDLYSTMSLSEKKRTVAGYEKRQREAAQQQQQQQIELQQQQMQQQQQIAQQQQQLQYQMHQEDNETKILVAQINGEAEAARLQLMSGDTDGQNAIENRKIDEQIRQFDAKMEQDKAKLSFDQQKHKDDVRLKERQIAKQNSTRNK